MVDASARFVVAASIMLAIVVSPLAAAAGPSLLRGQASGVAARTAGGTLETVPEVVLPASGGQVDEASASIILPEVMSVSGSTVSTTGAVAAGAAEAQSTAVVHDVDILNGIITATRVVAVSRSRSDGRSATSSAGGSAFLGLVVGGLMLGDVTPSENTRIELPGVGTLILNEHILQGNGWRSSGLTVTMIRLVLEGGQGDEILVGWAHSDVEFTAPSRGAAGPLNTATPGRR